MQIYTGLDRVDHPRNALRLLAPLEALFDRGQVTARDKVLFGNLSHACGICMVLRLITMRKLELFRALVCADQKLQIYVYDSQKLMGAAMAHCMQFLGQFAILGPTSYTAS